jgi:transposase
MRYQLTDHEWAAIRQMLPNKPHGVPQADKTLNRWKNIKRMR